MAMGRCPLCEGAVEVGAPCPERVCQRQGYHGIPEECFRRLAGASGEERDPVVGRLVGGEFLVVSRLGAGGFGRVYRALQRPVDQVVALKVMHREGTDGAMASSLARRFEGEARALAVLSHPNVVRLVKFGTHGDLPYLAMEYVPGQTLRERLAGMAGRGEELEEREVRHLVEQVVGALEAAHGLSLVHRDLKPDNLMVQEIPGDRWFVKVLDFGLAKFVEARTETSLVMGTPQYMAPEQIARRDIGPWTDLYALGAMTFEWVTGRRPFGGRTTQEILGRKLDPGYDVGSRVADLGMPEAALAFFRRSMARDVRERYRSAGEFREGFEGLWAALTGGGTTVRVGGDLTGLVDPSDLVRQSEEGRRLREERERLEREKADLERARAEAEKARREAERLRAEVENLRRGKAEKASEAVGTVAGGGISERPVGRGQAVSSRGRCVEAPGTRRYQDDTGVEGSVPGAVSARKPGVPKGWVWIPPGTFRMGSPEGEEESVDSERPCHEVTITRGFYLKAMPVTQGEWEDLVGNNPSLFNGRGSRECPVEQVSWWDAAAYCNALSRREGLPEAYDLVRAKGTPGTAKYSCGEVRFRGLDCPGYRLPTEAEWEYAARAGTEGARYGELGDVAWYDGNSGGSPHPVGGKQPNGWGLYDMLGNVLEWVWDWYGGYSSGGKVDPLGPQTGQIRVARGGSWYDCARLVRAANRVMGFPGFRSFALGFRPARSVQ
ncbi:SUMF1/EgtB/PvdO family nonheme iron enzyme [Myxococcota bacterium]|nr:SUMF1/EgtB/PvdO family nonheme iron enzyme [Myxococcota bacterium]